MKTVKTLVAALTAFQGVLLLMSHIIPPHGGPHDLPWWYQVSLLLTVAVVFAIEASETPRRKRKLTEAEKQAVIQAYLHGDER